MKFRVKDVRVERLRESHPTRGAWIEIPVAAPLIR